jgi:hypothetical protein
MYESITLGELAEMATAFEAVLLRSYRAATADSSARRTRVKEPVVVIGDVQRGSVGMDLLLMSPDVADAVAVMAD